MNTMKLREEKLDLIINIDNSKQSQGSIFFDNDDKNTIKDKIYYKVDLNFLNDKLEIHTDKNNLTKYDYNDHILDNIELWNINKVIDLTVEENKNKKFNCEIKYLKDLNKDKENIEGNFDVENNKITFDIAKNGKDISLFDIEIILFNF